jgi:hypothetical protein
MVTHWLDAQSASQAHVVPWVTVPLPTHVVGAVAEPLPSGEIEELDEPDPDDPDTADDEGKIALTDEPLAQSGRGYVGFAAAWACLAALMRRSDHASKRV